MLFASILNQMIDVINEFVNICPRVSRITLISHPLHKTDPNIPTPNMLLAIGDCGFASVNIAPSKSNFGVVLINSRTMNSNAHSTPPKFHSNHRLKWKLIMVSSELPIK